MSNSSVPTGEGARALADRGDCRSADGTRGWPGRHVHRSVLRYFARTDCSGALRDPTTASGSASSAPAGSPRSTWPRSTGSGGPRWSASPRPGSSARRPCAKPRDARRVRRHRADARRAATGRRLRGGPRPRRSRPARRSSSAGSVPRREAAGRHGRRGPPGSRPRSPSAGWWSPSAITCGRSSGCRRSARGSPTTRPPRDGALERRDAAAGVVAARGDGRRPGHRAGDPSLRPARIARRRGEVVGAASLHEARRRRPALMSPTPARPSSLRHGRRGEFANTRRQSAPSRRIAFSSAGLLIDHPEGERRSVLMGGRAPRRRGRDVLPAGPRPVRVQAEASSTRSRPATRAGVLDLRRRPPHRSAYAGRRRGNGPARLTATDAQTVGSSPRTTAYTAL